MTSKRQHKDVDWTKQINTNAHQQGQRNVETVWENIQKPELQSSQTKK